MKNFLRLFIAVDFTDDIKDRLFKLTKELKENTVTGHFTKRDNFHLTLAFIGETKEKEQVIQAMKNAVDKSRIEPFYLNIEGFGRFRGRNGDIFWTGVKESQDLLFLNKYLVRELQKFEFKMEERKFKPHLTLGREIKLKSGYTVQDFETLIPAMEMYVKNISLMKSERIDGRLVYTEVYRKVL